MPAIGLPRGGLPAYGGVGARAAGVRVGRAIGARIGGVRVGGHAAGPGMSVSATSIKYRP